MTLYFKSDTTVTPWAGEPINGICHPSTIEALWTDAELASFDR